MKNVNVKDYLKKEENATFAIQNAIDECFFEGGGEVLIPSGDYYISTIRLRSNITLRLLKDAHLYGSRNPEDYMIFTEDKINPVPENDKSDLLWKSVKERKSGEHLNKPASRWNNAMIKALDAENIAIIGEEGSFIDGRDCFDEVGEELYRGPHAINMHRCENLAFSGFEIKNSANWAYALFLCRNIKAENLKVTAGHDGIHLTSCDNITIKNSDFETGDDCIAGIDNLNVQVKDCSLNSSCSAFRFGGRDVLIENCHLEGPGKYLFRGSLTLEEKKSGVIAKNENHRQNMLSAFLYYADFSRPKRFNSGNIVIRNCTFKNVDRFLEYNFSGNNPWQTNMPLCSIRFENIKSEGIKRPLVLYGDKDVKASLEVINCSVEFSEDAKCSFMQLCNFDKVLLQDVNVKGCQNEVFIKKWSDDGEILKENLSLNGFSGEMEKMADTPFACAWI